MSVTDNLKGAENYFVTILDGGMGRQLKALGAPFRQVRGCESSSPQHFLVAAVRQAPVAK